MTREQEIIQEFVSRTDEIIKESINKHPRFAERRVGFIDGAQWADKTMIEKVMNWLDSIDMDMQYWNPEEGVLQGQFMDDLLKVMEK